MDEPPAIIDRFTYRPDVDGLRAVAVVAVLLFHARLGVSGGFVGVDVFFVISGYLITSLILKDLQRGRFSIVDFYERRARRILPALTIVIIACLAVGWKILFPSDYTSLAASAVCQAGFAANIYYWRTTGYFTPGVETRPLLHTWSLAVEEQFYMLFPLTLIVAYRWLRCRSRRSLALLFALMIATSLSSSIYAQPRAPAANFYLLPTRAWELLLGAILALFPATNLPHLARELMAAIGLAGILAPSLLYTLETPFPGVTALPPCVGASLVILANAPLEQPTLVGRLLSSRLVVFVGLISYSLYLWHWPLFAFSEYCSPYELPTWYRIALVGVSLALGAASWRFVEIPFRNRTVCATRRRIFRFSATSLLMCLVAGTAIYLSHGVPSRLPAEWAYYFPASASEDVQYERQTTVDDFAADELYVLGDRSPGAPATVLVWGDSHAAVAAPAIDELLARHHIAARAALSSAIPPLIGWQPPTGRAGTVELNDAAIEYLERAGFRHAILAGRWERYATNEEEELELRAAILRAVQRIVAADCTPWLLVQVPELPYQPRAVAARLMLLGGDQADYAPDVRAERIFGDPEFARAVTAAGGRILDPRPTFVIPGTNKFAVHRDGVCLYSDDDHISYRGARLILLPLLEATIGREL